MELPHGRSGPATQAENNDVGVEKPGHARRLVAVEIADRARWAATRSDEILITGQRAEEGEPARRIAVGHGARFHICKNAGAIRARFDPFPDPGGDGLVLSLRCFFNVTGEVVFQINGQRCHASSMAESGLLRNRSPWARAYETRPYRFGEFSPARSLQRDGEIR